MKRRKDFDSESFFMGQRWIIIFAAIYVSSAAIYGEWYGCGTSGSLAKMIAVRTYIVLSTVALAGWLIKLTNYIEDRFYPLPTGQG